MSLHHLITKLPVVRAWIEKTLAQHRAQARSVASCGFPRLTQFYSADTLTTASVVVVPTVPVPPLAEMGLGVLSEFQNDQPRGITYLDTYFVCESEARDESLHFHELVHVVQWRHFGPDRFLAAYLAGYLQAGNYRYNPLEVMAFGFQGHFDANGRPGYIEPFIRQECDQKILPMLERAIQGDGRQ